MSVRGLFWWRGCIRRRLRCAHSFIASYGSIFTIFVLICILRLLFLIFVFLLIGGRIVLCQVVLLGRSWSGGGIRRHSLVGTMLIEASLWSNSGIHSTIARNISLLRFIYWVMHWLCLLGYMRSIRFLIGRRSVPAALSVQGFHVHFVKFHFIFLLCSMFLSSLVLATRLRLCGILHRFYLNEAIFLGYDLLAIILCLWFLL